MSDKSELFYACEKFSERVTANSLDDECFINLAKAFREAVENKVQISFPTFLEDSQGRKIILAFADKRGELAGMYANPATLPAYKEVAKIPNISDKKNIEAIISGRCEVGDTVADIMTASFDEFLELVFDYPKLAGIRIIDVTSKLGSLTFDKDFILKLMLHAHLPKINRKFYPPRDWGKGIPD